MKALFIIGVGLLILVAGLQLGMKAGYDLAQRQAEEAYIEQYMEAHVEDWR